MVVEEAFLLESVFVYDLSEALVKHDTDGKLNEAEAFRTLHSKEMCSFFPACAVILTAPDHSHCCYVCCYVVIAFLEIRHKIYNIKTQYYTFCIPKHKNRKQRTNIGGGKC